ncbi:MAG: endonuclease Q family protein [Candidatus Micrarchaeaceae archaeon]
MDVIADLHVHSRFAMACSKNITLRGMERTALMKGINVLSTGDFTHPLWMEEIRKELEEDGEGTYKIKGSDGRVKFILGSEVCTVFDDGNGKQRRIHNCILMPSLESAEALNAELASKGNLSSDGRPVVNMRASELVEAALSASKDAFVFPAHAWTPWFGVFGSMSGFDSMKDAYEDQEKHIRALETGLSSDPKMNWMVSKLDKYSLISNSDFHSLQKMGREANIFKMEKITYHNIISAIVGRRESGFDKTIEFYPEEGKYHFDGHRNCKFSIDPARSNTSVCPVCGRRLVRGVMHRVIDLADREYGYVPSSAVPYVNLIPLIEILSYVAGKSAFSPIIIREYERAISELGPEMQLLISADLGKIEESMGADVAHAIENIRDSRVNIKAGYDGVFGEIDPLGRKNYRGKDFGVQKELGNFM